MVEKTKEQILQIARTWAQLDEKAFLALLKEKGIDGKFDSAKWDEYMAAIKSIVRAVINEGPKCEICQAPMVNWVQAHIALLVCSTCRTHTFACKTASLIQAFHPGTSRADALTMARGAACTHGVPISECHKCGIEAMRANIEKNSLIGETNGT